MRVAGGKTMLRVTALLAVLLATAAATATEVAETGRGDASAVDEAGKEVAAVNTNVTIGKSLEDEFLDDLTDQCLKDTSMSCLRRNLYGYVDKSLDKEDLQITESLTFTKNEREEGRVGRSMGGAAEEEEAKTADDALYEKGARFLMNHDVSIQLPKTFFEGALLKFSPRSLEEDGVLIKLELPKAPSEDSALEESEKGRLFFHSHKKHFKKRLIMGFFALLLVIKLIKVKLLYLLPLILGVGTVKKLILKALIFIFPAFASLFKYCAGHKTHHHHTVAYHHRPVEASIFDDWGPFGGAYHHRRNEFSSSASSGDGHYSEYSSAPGHHYDRHPAPYKGYHPFINEDDQVSRSALSVTEPTVFHYPPAHPNSNLRPPVKHAGYSKAAYTRPLQPPPPQQIHQPPSRYPQPKPRPVANSPPHAPQQQAVAASVKFVPAQPVHIATAGGNQKIYSPNVDETVVRSQITMQQQQAALQQQQHALQQQVLLQQQALALQRQHQLQRQQALLLQQQKAQTLTPTPPVATESSSQTQRVYDSFYSPILQKMDNVFTQMGFNDEGCRERLVCSMYKSPARFSPHSNLISAELSRDPSELKKPTTNNAAVVRFYRYVQAAKDGQEGRDCLRLYAACSVKTEK